MRPREARSQRRPPLRPAGAATALDREDSTVRGGLKPPRGLAAGSPFLGAAVAGRKTGGGLSATAMVGNVSRTDVETEQLNIWDDPTLDDDDVDVLIARGPELTEAVSRKDRWA